MPELLSEKFDRVQLLTLNRPEIGNRVSKPLAQALLAALDAAEADAGIGAVVLTGAGENFCVGGDHAGSGNTPDAILDFAHAFGSLNRRLQGLGKPVMAAINGNAHAGGFSLVSCCDIAVMNEDATLALPELAHGLFPILAMATVQRLMGRKLFFELAYEGRRLTASEAMSLWLVNEACPADKVLERTLERANRVAAAPASVLKLGRRGYDAMQGGDLDVALRHAQAVLPLLSGVRA